MKTRLALLVLLFCPVALWGADRVQIRATKKTGSREKGAAQDLPRGASHATKTEKYYRFECRSMSTSVPESLKAEWVVLLESSDGRLLPAAYGSTNLSLPVGRTAVLETDSVSLYGREWDGRRAGEVTDEIAGYGFRLTDSEGARVADKFDPPSKADEIREALEKKAKAEESGSRPALQSREPVGDRKRRLPSKRPRMPRP
jgi:hypothetical protein